MSAGFNFADEVCLTGYTCSDIYRVLDGVERFANCGPVAASSELAHFIAPGLSADALANIAFELRLRLQVEARP
jgi:hypothetical protein